MILKTLSRGLLAAFTLLCLAGPSISWAAPDAGVDTEPSKARIPLIKCPQDIYDWLDTTAAWPLTTVEVGDQSYDRESLTVLLDDEDLEESDASIALASELVAAKLNRAYGVTWTPLDDLLADAEAALAGRGA